MGSAGWRGAIASRFTIRRLAWRARRLAHASGKRGLDLASHLGLSRRGAYWLGGTLVAAAALTTIVLVHVFPAPPKRVIMATAAAGTSFEQFGRRYAEIFARSGITLDVRETTGSRENLDLLKDRSSGVDAAFMTGWIERADTAGRLLSLGVVFNSPIWIFHRIEFAADKPKSLAGARIAVGARGAAVRSAAEKILGPSGVDESNARFSDETGQAAANSLREGKVDAAVLISDFEAPAVQALLRDPAIRLLDMPLAEAFTRIHPELNRLVLPKGVLGMEPPAPPTDVTLLATVNRVLVRDDLHPGIIHLLLNAMREVHGRHGIFQRPGDFPRGTDPEYEMAASAIDYYRSGPTWLQRTLPLWLTAHVQRGIALLLALVAIVIPLLQVLPRLVKMLVNERFVPLYRRIRDIERELLHGVSSKRLEELLDELGEIERAAAAVRVPIRHLDVFYGFAQCAHLLRLRMLARGTARSTPSDRN